MIIAILFILKLIIALYIFSRGFIHNDPLKTKTENLFAEVNSFLNELKAGSESELILRSRKRARQISYISFALLLIAIFIPANEVVFKFMAIDATIFCVSVLILLSIYWLREHKKTLRQIISNPFFIFFLLFPVLWYFFNDTLIHSSRDPQSTKVIVSIFKFLFDYSIIELLTFQILWIISITIFFYLGVSALVLPIYFLLYLMIFAVVNFLRGIEKYISNQLTTLDIIVGILCAFEIFL